MRKKVIVLSLGGSLIIPDDVNLNYLQKFRQIILRNTNKYKFIIVCGGGSIARKYIFALEKAGLNEEFQSFSGISATRMNARFMSYLFKINPHKGIPHTLKTVRKYIRKQDVVFCGALEYNPKQTSDSTAVEIAKYFKAIFINLTNVAGLYNKNPFEHKDAKFISEISWKEFYNKFGKGKFKPGQHFVLDQTASRQIFEHKIPTYILGKNLSEFEKLLKNKKFKGTTIEE